MERGAEITANSSYVTCSNVYNLNIKGTAGKTDTFYINGCFGEVDVAQDRDLLEPDNDIVIINSTADHKSDVIVFANTGDKINSLNITEPVFFERIKSE